MASANHAAILNVLPIPIPTGTSTRLTSTLCDLPKEASSFQLGTTHRSYRHQFSNIYFVRLRLLREAVERRAWSRWKDVDGTTTLVPSVLEVVKNQTCFIIGTVYMEMSLKPNVLDDVDRDRSLPAPPARDKYHSPNDAFMLEDESGRIQLVGDILTRTTSDLLEAGSMNMADLLVTGVIMAAFGRETASGEFQVIDVCFAGMAPMMCKAPSIDTKEYRMDVDNSDRDDVWVALLSGLEITSSEEKVSYEDDARMQMLVEYLSGEAGGQEDQQLASRITRLIIAGNSLAAPEILQAPQPTPVVEQDKRGKRFGQEPSTFSSLPTNTLGSFLRDVAEVMPVHLLAGSSDPAGILLPQQALPRGMFGSLKNNDNLVSETNPAWITVEPGEGEGDQQDCLTKRSILVHSGQPVEDMFKYVPTTSNHARLDLACSTLRWRHIAPTAPDTLWCYPFFTDDPFILRGTPDLLVVGCQPSFATRIISSKEDDPEGESDEERTCRVVLVPKFSETGTIVLVNMKNMDVRSVEFGTRLGEAVDNRADDS